MNKQGLGIAFALFLITGTPQLRAQIHITIGPPARPHEVVPPPPPEHRDWAWHAGYHRWEGDHYVWVPGAYVEPPHPHARWVDGHWDRRGGEYVWVEGHWR
jgi:WXXGXW repeat (2 copies)